MKVAACNSVAYVQVTFALLATLNSNWPVERVKQPFESKPSQMNYKFLILIYK